MQELASRNPRTFRTFLLLSQFEAREIGHRIAEARTVAGLTQETVAEMASFSKRSLQDYEAGVTIPYKHMRELSLLLGRPVEWFLHGEEEQATATAVRLAEVETRLGALEARVAETGEKMLAAIERLADLVEHRDGQSSHRSARGR